jgi:hypothetical protein
MAKRQRVRLGFAILLLAALVACGPLGTQSSPSPAESGGLSRGGYDMAKAAPPPSGAEQPASPAEGGVLLAYSYSIGIEAPKERVAPLVASHEKACMDAGPKLCQVLGSSVNAYGEDQVSGYLNLRAEPDWLAGFRATIEGDAVKFGGRITSNAVSTEDLTQFIVDSEARLEAKKILRERIKALLETRQGSLSDVLAAERELANVQGEIDAMTASLAAARARIAMSALSISYQSDPETSVSMFKPLVEAVSNFGRNSMASLGEAIDFVARAWPFFLIGLFALWVLRAVIRGWRRSRAKG